VAHAQSPLKTMEQAAQELAAALHVPAPRGQAEREALTRAARRAMDSPDLRGITLGSDAWRSHELAALLDAGTSLTRIHRKFDQAVTTDAWDQDLLEVRATLSAKGASWSRRFSGEYRRAHRRVSGLLRQGKPPALEDRVRLIDAILEEQGHRASVTKQDSLGRELFGPRWEGERSDWDALSQLTDWVQVLRQDVGNGQLPPGIVDFLEGSPHVDHLGPLVKAVEEASLVHAGTAEAIRSGLESARRDLLDLGLRNPLLNYRLLRTRGLEVADELPAEVYRILLEEGRTMSFLPLPEEVPDDLVGQPAEDEPPAGPAARHTDTRLQTGLPSQELQARLLSTYHLANTFLQEQGVNTLFLALGMLTWYEDDGGDTARRAPLVLLPVALERSNVRDRFHLRHTGEDPGDNLSLRGRLRTEFRVTLPNLPEPDDLDIGEYLDAVETAIGDLPRWSVDRSSIVLGFFSFNKYLMYRDLDSDIWPEGVKPFEHPIMGALLSEGFDEPAPTIDTDDNLDRHLPPDKVYHVLDADSSQALALVDVNQGRNLVVQGPPGTGKSQTITNMIAEALGHGRTVLFVSEKMAALEVVKRRLAAVGLGDACLELHSHKSTKKAVLDELKRTLELGRPRLGQLESDLDTLTSLRDRLNAYCEAVNGPIGDSGVNPYQAYGELALLQLRTDGVNLPKLDIPSIQDWSEAEVRRKEDLVRELQARLSTGGVPQCHPFWGVRRRQILPADLELLHETLSPAQVSLDRLVDAASDLAGRLGLKTPTTPAEAQGICLGAKMVLSSPELTGVNFRATDWRTRREDLDALVRAGSELSRLYDLYGRVLTPAAWEQDLSQLRATLDINGRKWWRLLSTEYRRARDKLARLCLGSLPSGIDAQVRMLDAVTEARGLGVKVTQGNSLGQSAFGARWQSENSDWAALSELAAWVFELYLFVDGGQVPEGIIDFLAEAQPTAGIEEALGTVKVATEEHCRLAGAVVEVLDLDAAKRFGSGDGLADQPFAVQSEALDVWKARLNDIHDIVGFNNLSDSCAHEGLAPVSEAAVGWAEAADHLLDAFHLSWYEALVAKALAERETLARFDGPSHQQIVDRFKELDSLSLQRNRARLAMSHWERLPRQEGGGQLGTLRREFQKRRRHLPIRRLIEQAGNAVQALKPVFMMSPLSIATYIPPGSLSFDLVIFDEASQVRPVDAFGAILRAGQVVVVGDSQQLPPTSFFDTAGQATEEDDENVTTDIESVLGLFAAQNAPDRMLRWHYRSRHESLIAVSNSEFYNNSLVVFPSPDAERAELGLWFHHLPDTVYDRGRTRTNPREAEAVAQAMMEHARSSPHLTLGVAAFSVAQMQAIQDQLEIFRRGDPSLEGFFAAHPNEPFFVKNLENVQGDERDVIFISIGYGRDADGRIDMNFGPLNKDGGERRLNVLITRAKQRCEVFTNLTADDIDSQRTGAPGVRSLKAFLDYAASDGAGSPQEDSDGPAPPLQQAVASALAEAGYELRHQVGAAGHSIDLAVVDQERGSHYVLGIETDGPTYNSSHSSRDRDRLRQQVLEGLGWRIHRIWSTEWFRRPERELHRALLAIQSANTPTAGSAVSREAVSSPPRDISQLSKPVAPGAVEYRVANLKIDAVGPEFWAASEAAMALWVAEVVETESPVHREEVARRISGAAGLRRGKRFDSTIDQAINHAVELGRMRLDAPFLWWKDADQPALRDRSKLPAASRKIDLVAPEELSAAAHKVVAASYGIAQNDVPVAAARLLGFGRVTTEMRDRFDPVIRSMIASGVLVRRGDQLLIAEPPEAEPPESPEPLEA